jgi:hypothetical protein
MVLADYSKTPAKVAHIKPLPPSQKRRNRTGTKRDLNKQQASGWSR